MNRIVKMHSRHGELLVDTVLSHSEKEIMALQSDATLWLAQSICLKEAAVKALGTGFSNGIWWSQIEVAKINKGMATLKFTGAAEQQLKKIECRQCIALVSVAGAMVLANVSLIT